MDPFTNALTIIAGRAPGALRSDLVGFESTLKAIGLALQEIEANVASEHIDPVTTLLEGARHAVHARKKDWYGVVESLVAASAPSMTLRPVFTPSDVQSYLSSGIDEVIYQAREMGEFIHLVIGGVDHGDIDCYGAETTVEGMLIKHDKLPGGRLLIPLSDIHAVWALDGLAFLVAQPLQKNGITPYLIEISVDHRPAKLADYAAL